MWPENIYYMLIYSIQISVSARRLFPPLTVPFVHALLSLLHQALTSCTEAAHCHVTCCKAETDATSCTGITLHYAAFTSYSRVS
jgi:hypothetical protein